MCVKLRRETFCFVPERAVEAYKERHTKTDSHTKVSPPSPSIPCLVQQRGLIALPCPVSLSLNLLQRDETSDVRLPSDGINDENIKLPVSDVSARRRTVLLLCCRRCQFPPAHPLL